MPKFETLNAGQMTEIAASKCAISGAIETLFAKYKFDTTEFIFPQPVKFGEVEYASLPRKLAEGIIGKLHQEGNLLIAVTTSYKVPLIEVKPFRFNAKTTPGLVSMLDRVME